MLHVNLTLISGSFGLFLGHVVTEERTFLLTIVWSSVKRVPMQGGLGECISSVQHKYNRQIKAMVS